MSKADYWGCPSEGGGEYVGLCGGDGCVCVGAFHVYVFLFRCGACAGTLLVGCGGKLLTVEGDGRALVGSEDGCAVGL